MSQARPCPPAARIRAVALSVVVALTGLSAVDAARAEPTRPAKGAETPQHVIGPGQERRVAQTLGNAVAGAVLHSAAVERDRIVARFGRTADGETTLGVTLVHPDGAPPGAPRVRGVALLQEPGPADGAAVQRLARRLESAGKGAIVRWTRLEPEAPVPTEPSPGDEQVPDEPGTADAAPEDDTDDPAWRQAITRAEHLAERGDRDAARQVLSPMGSRAASSPWRRVDLAAVYAQLGDIERARKLVAPALEGPTRWIALAVTGDLPVDAEVVAAFGADAPCGALEAARMLKRVGSKDRAEPLLAAIVAAGRCPKAVEALGQLMLDARRQEEALAFLRAHRPTDPPDVGVETLIGHTLRNAGQYAESIAILEPLARQDPVGQSRLLAPLLTMYLWLGEAHTPLDRWRRQAEADPDDVVTTFLLGAVLHYRGKYEESNRWMDSLVGRLDDVPRVYIYRGMNRLNLGDFEGARRLLDQATELPYVDPDVYFCRAEVERDRDRALAIDDLERFLQLKRKLTYSYGFKLFRVEQMLASLRRCQADGTEECPGPFEHPRDRFVQRFWQRLGLALAAAAAACIAIALWRRRRT